MRQKTLRVGSSDHAHTHAPTRVLGGESVYEAIKPGVVVTHNQRTLTHTGGCSDVYEVVDRGVELSHTHTQSISSV